MVKVIAIPLGPTDDFPDGKMNNEDQGGLMGGIVVENGRIIIHFGQEVDWIGFDPASAKVFAAQLIVIADNILSEQK